jgi:hypothetical protein
MSTQPSLSVQVNLALAAGGAVGPAGAGAVVGAAGAGAGAQAVAISARAAIAITAIKIFDLIVLLLLGIWPVSKALMHLVICRCRHRNEMQTGGTAGDLFYPHHLLRIGKYKKAERKQSSAFEKLINGNTRFST